MGHTRGEGRASVRDCFSFVSHKLDTFIAKSYHLSLLVILGYRREASSNALAACIAAFGGLFPNHIRGTLDSITHTCLSTLYLRGCSSIFAYSHVKRAMLQLGTNCACVPWGDGGRSTISDVVRTVSTMLRRDPDVSVASAALSTLCVFDAFATPRAPPILIPTRGGCVGETASDGGALTASALMRGISKSRVEIAASTEAQEERRATKIDKKVNKKARREAIDVATQAELDSKRIIQSNPHIAEEAKVVDGVVAVANESSESEIISTPGRDCDISVVRDKHAFVTQSPPSNSINTEEMVKDVTNDHLNDPQTTVSDRHSEGVDSSMLDVHAEKKDEGNEAEDSDDSMDDFPDIVDEDPDEEDIAN